MQVIFYAGGEFLTGDDIADALLEYSRALGQEDMAQIVDIPVRESDGSTSVARFLIGPASQIVTKSAPGSGEELRDDAVAQMLRARTRGVDYPQAHWTDETASRSTAADDF